MSLEYGEWRPMGDRAEKCSVTGRLSVEYRIRFKRPLPTIGEATEYVRRYMPPVMGYGGSLSVVLGRDVVDWSNTIPALWLRPELTGFDRFTYSHSRSCD